MSIARDLARPGLWAIVTREQTSGPAATKDPRRLPRDARPTRAACLAAAP